MATQLALIVLGCSQNWSASGSPVREVRQRRSDVQAYRTSLQTVHLRGRLESANATMSATLTVSGGEPPTVEQRLDALEAGLGVVRGEVTDAERRAVHKARDYASQVAAEVLDDARREVGAVRDLLLRVTEPNWQVWTSLGLLVLGVALQSLASALGVSR